MAVYYQGSGIPVVQMNHMRPRPERGRAGAGGASMKTRDQSLKSDYTQKLNQIKFKTQKMKNMRY
jgi:hypothetical protein